MDVMTVTGPVRAGDLGVTLIHEHILFNGDWHHRPIEEELSRRAIGESRLRMETLGWARKYGYEHLDNSHRVDPEEAMRGRTAPRLIEIARQEGADPSRIIICHVDQDARCPPGYHREIADMGAYLGFDTFGHYDFYTYGRRAGPNRVYATDWDRAERI